jgi:hypothetical protein
VGLSRIFLTRTLSFPQRTIALYPRIARFIAPFPPFVASRWKRKGLVAKVLPSKARTQQKPGKPINRREPEMNVLKHMESLFLVAALVVGVSTWASAESYKAHVRADAMVSVGSEKMAVVKVSGKRLAPATKFA